MVTSGSSTICPPSDSLREMSSTPPPRRRRIAGERRRPSGAPFPDDTAAATPSPPAAPPPPTAATTLTSSAPPEVSERPGLRKRLRTARPQRRGGAVRVESPAQGSAAGRRSWWGTRPSIVALVVALALLLTLVVLAALGMLGNTGVREIQDAEDSQVAAETAPSVAERAAEAILAYDHRSLDADQDTAERFMTSSFAEEYAKTFDDSVEPTARTYRAQVTAEVKGSSVIRASDDRVRVLLFVDQTTQSTAHQQPQVALNRVQFDMVLVEGDWLVDDISSY